MKSDQELKEATEKARIGGEGVLMRKAGWAIGIALTVLAIMLRMEGAGKSAEDEMLQMLGQDRPYHTVSADLFERLGWDLPDGGSQVKSLAGAAPGGAFDPKELESLNSNKLGYRARWHEVRYKLYGLDWDIAGLELTPNHPVAGLPTLAIIHGGSANWYEFFVDPFNNPGLGQYLAQKVPVLLITIPGNYKPGGWTEPSHEKRIPAYLLHKEISEKEARVRNAVYTFRVVTEGVRQLIEKTTTGPVVAIGHSTGGHIPYLLEGTSLKARLNGLFLGWGSGGPPSVEKLIQGEEKHRQANLARFSGYPNVSVLRSRIPDGENGYVQSKFIGPLNPCKGSTEAEVARCWFHQEERRRPQFKQVLQYTESQGAEELRDKLEKEIRENLADNAFGVKADEVAADLFTTVRAPLTGYKRMIWLVGRLDNGHWNLQDPEKAGDLKVANEFRKRNPQVPIRFAVFDVPMTHYGHIEKPRQLAGGMITALRWLLESQAQN